MGKKPIIGITTGYVKKNDFVQGPYVHEDYLEAVTRADAVPVLLPYQAEGAAEQLLGLCDGLILSGGSDIDPRFYDEDPLPQIEWFNTERDQFEMKLLRLALAADKPILGICRGFQLMNVAFGGSLIQDLQTQREQAIQHVQRVPRVKATHSVRLLPDSGLSRLFDRRESVFVNSLHHQAIKTLAAELKAVAFAGDGVIEAAEHRNSERILGVQWHPESMTAGGDPLMLRLFRQFVRQCDRPVNEPVPSGSDQSITE